jgi:hypothetical protein
VFKHLRMNCYFRYNCMNSYSNAQCSIIYRCDISVIALWIKRVAGKFFVIKLFAVHSQKQDIRETEYSGRKDFIYVNLKAHVRNITFLFLTRTRLTPLPSALRLAEQSSGKNKASLTGVLRGSLHLTHSRLYIL